VEITLFTLGLKMARQINGHVGSFTTSADLISKFPPAEYMGCSANVGTTAPYIKYWCDGQTWAGVNASAIQALVSVDGNLATAGGRARNRVLKRMLDTVGVAAANSGTAATVTLEANSPWGTGIPAYKVVMPAGNNWNEVQLTGVTNIPNFDGHVAWRIWIEDYTAVGQVTVYAGTSGYGKLSQQNHSVNASNTNRYNGEHIAVAGALRAAQAATFVHGTDTLADTKLRITPGAGGATVWVRDVVIPGVGRPTHVITHDDASVTWMTACLPVLAANGLTATFGVNTGQLGTSAALYLSNAQVAEIAAAGHQVSCHNVDNIAHADGTGGTQDAATYTAAFVTASNVLTGIIGGALDTTYHPWVQGRNTQALHDAMRTRGVRIARGTDDGYDIPQIGLGNNVLSLKTRTGPTATPTQIDAMADAVVKYGVLCVWMVHEVTPNGGAGVETPAASYAYLVNRIGSDVRAGRAVHRTMAQLGRELYAERLVTPALLGY